MPQGYLFGLLLLVLMLLLHHQPLVWELLPQAWNALPKELSDTTISRHTPVGASITRLDTRLLLVWYSSRLRQHTTHTIWSIHTGPGGSIQAREHVHGMWEGLSARYRAGCYEIYY